MPNEGDRNELNCAKCQKVTAHVFEIIGMIPELTLKWCCSVCGTVILEKEVDMKVNPRVFLEYLYQYSGVSAEESIRTSLKVIADVFDVPLWTAARIMRHLKKDELANMNPRPNMLVRHSQPKSAPLSFVPCEISTTKS